MMASLTLPGAATKMVLEVVTALLEVNTLLNFLHDYQCNFNTSNEDFLRVFN